MADQPQALAGPVDGAPVPVHIDPAAMRAHAIETLEALGALRSGSKAKKVNALAKAVTQTLPVLARNVDLLASAVEQLLGERAVHAARIRDLEAEVRDLVEDRDPGLIDKDAPCASCGALPGTFHPTWCFYSHVLVGGTGDLGDARALYDATRTAKDGAYAERNQLVAALARLAPALGWTAGIARTAIEGWDPAWHNCVYIDTPAGQLSWHYHDVEAALFAGLPPYTGVWDGHTTPEKYERLRWLGVDRPFESEELPDDPEATRDLLLTVFGDERLAGDGVPSLETIAAWTPAERLEVELYAAAVHAAAGDHDDMEIPPRPAALDREGSSHA